MTQGVECNYNPSLPGSVCPPENGRADEITSPINVATYVIWTLKRMYSAITCGKGLSVAPLPYK